MHQSELRQLIGAANQRDAARGFIYHGPTDAEVHRLLPFVSRHKRTLYHRPTAEAFVRDLFAGKIAFVIREAK